MEESAGHAIRSPADNNDSRLGEPALFPLMPPIKCCQSCRLASISMSPSDRKITYDNSYGKL